MKKKPVGRPRKNPSEKKEIRTVYVSKEIYEFYFINGGGNFSKGIELIAKKLESINEKSKK